MNRCFKTVRRYNLEKLFSLLFIMKDFFILKFLLFTLKTMKRQHREAYFPHLHALF